MLLVPFLEKPLQQHLPSGEPFGPLSKIRTRRPCEENPLLSLATPCTHPHSKVPEQPQSLMTAAVVVWAVAEGSVLR